MTDWLLEGIQQYNQGVPVSEIARQANRSKQAVHQRLQAVGLSTPRRPARNIGAAITVLRQAGWSRAEIGSVIKAHSAYIREKTAYMPIALTCGMCGGAFIGMDGRRYCCERCINRAGTRRKNARNGHKPLPKKYRPDKWKHGPDCRRFKA